MMAERTVEIHVQGTGRFKPHHAFPNCLFPTAGDNPAMSSRETVIDLVTRLPEDMPLAEIAREIELLAGLKTAREQARRREGIPAEDARKLVEAWTAK
jgi:hypothetical protein